MKTTLQVIFIVFASLLCVRAQSEKALEYMQFDVWSVLERAQELRSEGEFDKAIDLLSTSIMEHPNNGYLFLQRALCLYQKGKGDPVLSDVRAAAALVPIEYVVHNGVEILRMNKQDADALQLISEFIARRPTSEGSYFLRAQIRLEEKHYQEAFDDALESARLEPFAFRSNFLLQILHKLKGGPATEDNYSRTISLLETKSKILDSPEFSEQYSKIALNGEIETAQNTCGRTLRTVITEYARLLDAKGSIADADAALSKILNTKPKKTALEFHAEIEVSRYRFVEAIDDLTKVIEIPEQSATERAVLFLKRSEAYLRTSQPEKAAADVSSAKALDSTVSLTKPRKAG